MFSVTGFSAAPLATSPGSVFGGVVGESLTADSVLSVVDSVFNVTMPEGVDISEQIAPVNNVYGSVFSDRVRAVTTRYVGAGYASGAFASGPFSGLGDEFREFSGDFVTLNFIYSVAMQPEGARGSDSLSNTAVQDAAVEVGAEAQDQTGVFLTVNRSVAESAEATDQTSSIPTYLGSIQEQARTATLREVGGGYSSGAFASGAFSALGDESRLVSGDAMSSRIIANDIMQEGVNITDTPTNNAIQDAAFDAAAAMSAINGMFLTVNRSVSESGSVTDQNSSIPTYLGRIQEQAEGVDETVAVANFAATIADNAVPLDVTFNNVVYKSLASNKVTANDKLFSQLVVTIPITEAALITDPLTARKQWEPINTFEVTDWILVNTSKPN